MHEHCIGARARLHRAGSHCEADIARTAAAVSEPLPEARHALDALGGGARGMRGAGHGSRHGACWAKRMETHRPYTEALLAAVDTLGGEKELADRLGVDAKDLHAWLQGRAAPPLGAFLEALDVIAAGPYSRRHPRARVAVLPESPSTTN